MAAVGEVCAGLIRHKTILSRELADTNILDVLVKKGIFSVSDLELITGASDSEKCNYFIQVVSKQSGAKLGELCSVLDKECPKLSKELKNDRHRFIVNGAVENAKENMVMSHNLYRFVSKKYMIVIAQTKLWELFDTNDPTLRIKLFQESVPKEGLSNDVPMDENDKLSIL